MGDSIDAMIKAAARALKDAKQLAAKKRADGSMPPPAEAPASYDPHRKSHAVAPPEAPPMCDLDEGVAPRGPMDGNTYLAKGAHLREHNRKIMQYLDWLKRQTRTALMSHWYDAFKEPPPEDVSRDWLICGLSCMFRMNLYQKLGIESGVQGMMKFDFMSVKALLLIGDGIHREGGDQIYDEPTGREEFQAPKYLRLVAVPGEGEAFTGKRLMKFHIVKQQGAVGVNFKELTFYLDRLGLGGKRGAEKSARQMFTKWVKEGWCKTTLPEGAPEETIASAEEDELEEDDSELETVATADQPDKGEEE